MRLYERCRRLPTSAATCIWLSLVGSFPDPVPAGMDSHAGGGRTVAADGSAATRLRVGQCSCHVSRVTEGRTGVRCGGRLVGRDEAMTIGAVKGQDCSAIL